jgi:IclR family KDG regulon transcriptional repressor
MPQATNSLDRALFVLKVIEQTPGGLRHTDISRRLNIPPSTCSYIIGKLEREGYLARDRATGRYRVGLAPVALAYGALREIGIRSVAEPALYKLTSATGLSAGIGVLERGRVLLVDRVEGFGFVNRALAAAERSSGRLLERAPYLTRAQRDVGRELPAHSTALGKVLLAYLPRPRVLEVIAKAGLPRYTRHTIVSRPKLLAELEVVRAQGYALADQEAYREIRALAAPIFDEVGSVRAAVSVNGSPDDPVWIDIHQLMKVVGAAARDISRRARYRIR